MSWTIKKAEHWRIVLLNCGAGKDSRESLRQRGDQTSNRKGNQPWVFIGRTDAKAETPIFGHLMRRTESLEKTLMLGTTEGRRRRGWQNEMVGWHLWLNGHEFEQALEVGDGQGSLAGCSPWSHKSRTWLRDWTELTPNNNDYDCDQSILKEIHPEYSLEGLMLKLKLI